MNKRFASRLVLAAAVLAALALSGCGRKGPLDPPPTAAVPPPGYTAAPQRSLGEENTFAPVPGERSPRAQPAAPAQPEAAPQQRKTFPLDFLLGGSGTR